MNTTTYTTPSTAPVYDTKHMILYATYNTMGPQKGTESHKKKRLTLQIYKRYPEYKQLAQQNMNLVNEIREIERKLYCRGTMKKVRSPDGVLRNFTPPELFYKDPEIQVLPNLPLPGLEWIHEEYCKNLLKAGQTSWQQYRYCCLKGDEIFNLVYLAVTGQCPDSDYEIDREIRRAWSAQGNKLEWEVLALRYNLKYLGYAEGIMTVFDSAFHRYRSILIASLGPNWERYQIDKHELLCECFPQIPAKKREAIPSSTRFTWLRESFAEESTLTKLTYNPHFFLPWSVHALLIDYSLALMGTPFSAYVLMWILDYIMPFRILRQVVKIRTISNVMKFYQSRTR